jgi:hypothetical protein
MLLPGLSIRAQVKESQQPEKERWEFSSFGPDAGGKIRYDKKAMTMATQRTRHCFDEADSYSFAWQKQAFPYDDCSKSTITVTIDKFGVGSAGIMMRSGTQVGAANAHLEATATGDVLLFYRKADGEATSYTRIASLSFPMQLKLVRQGTVFTGYYKNESGEWIKGNSVIAGVSANPLVGFYGCSGSNAQIGYSGEANENMEVRFSNWNISYEENFIPAEKDFKDKMPVKEGTLLRDNFDDGSLSNAPASIINPVWDGIQFGNLPYDKAGGRNWRKTGDGTFYLGNKKWADYQVSIDLSFDSARKSNSEFLLQLRYQNISVYAAMLRYYAVAFREGNKLFFEKYELGAVSFSKAVTIPPYTDGVKHTIMVKLLDKNYEVYFDNKKLIEGIDAERPVTYGNICLKFTNVAMNLDNLEVIKINDPVNGVADNYLQDYYDTPLPAYLKKYGY